MRIKQTFGGEDHLGHRFAEIGNPSLQYSFPAFALALDLQIPCMMETNKLDGLLLRKAGSAGYVQYFLLGRPARRDSSSQGPQV